MNVVDDECSGDDCDQDKATILSASSISKKSHRLDYLTFGNKKLFNLLRHIFIQAPIF